MSSIIIKLVVDLLADNNKHEFYELHQKYRLTPAEIKKSVNFLEIHNIVEVAGNEFWLSGELSSFQLHTLYESIKNRNLELDKEHLDKIKKESQPLNELYTPNLKILDSTLLID